MTTANMKRIPIGEASPAQLREFAEIVLGLEIAKTSNSATTIAKIEAAAPGTTEILVADAPPPPEPAPAGEVAPTAGLPGMDTKGPTPAPIKVPQLGTMDGSGYKDDPRIEVLINSTNDVGGKRDVPVAVNGVTFIIRRGEWVEVPYRVYEALDNAKEHAMSQSLGRDGESSHIDEAVAHSYSFSSRNNPSAEAIAAWRARTDELVGA